jgi:dTDP-L-rhamnose 4-epimerase
MAGALADAFGEEAPRPMVSGEWRAGDVRHVFASTQRATEVLGFEAQVSFADGMRELAHAPFRSSVGDDGRRPLSE